MFVSLNVHYVFALAMFGGIHLTTLPPATNSRNVQTQPAFLN